MVIFDRLYKSVTFSDFPRVSRAIPTWPARFWTKISPSNCLISQRSIDEFIPNIMDKSFYKAGNEKL